MQLEEQVCSLELAKRLKELGLNPDAVFSWYEATDVNDPASSRASEKSCDMPAA